MNRQFRKFGIVFFVGIMTCGFSTQALAEIMLKKSIVVEDEFVTFGDLFNADGFIDKEEAQHIRIARAPAPGRQSKLSPNRVRAAAAKHGLHWRNVERVQTISVKRASDMIPAEDIKAAISRAIEESGTSGNVQVQIPLRNLKFYVSKGSMPELVVRLDEYDPRRKFFRGELSAIDENGVETTRPISGRAVTVISVPVLSEAIGAGEIIAKTDLEWVDYPTDRITGNMVTDASELVGMSPKRSLRASVPVRLADVRLPVVAAKGTAVTVLFQSRGISLSINGRAMEDGARGQFIRILNLRSNRIVEAEVTGPGKVRVLGTSFTPI